MRLARRIRDGDCTSVELLELLLARVEQLDGPINSVVTLEAESARQAALAADRRTASGEPVGPLHGVCMTIKDSFQTAGIRTTSGAPELSDFVPTADADPVARLKAAGAIVFGKTNLPIYAGDTQSYNEIFGQTNNPWNLERTCGGSSGGAAAALAAGFTPLELGSDIGGSIRGPASTCGICGHKPSYGIVSARGQIPGPPGTLTQADLAVAGPMARSVPDLELAMDVLVGPDAWHAPAVAIQLPPPRHRELRDYRVAVWLDEPSAPIDPAVREQLLHVVEALEDAGATVSWAARPQIDFDKALETFRRLLSAALSGGFSLRDLEQAAADPQGARSASSAEKARAALRHREWLSLNERRLQMRQRWLEFFRDWDAVVLPTLPTTAPAHDHSEPMSERTIEIGAERRPYGDQMNWVGLTGLVYLPATVIPAGIASDGLPVGVQLAGPFLEDRTCLDLARRLDAILDVPRSPL